MTAYERVLVDSVGTAGSFDDPQAVKQTRDRVEVESGRGAEGWRIRYGVERRMLKASLSCLPVRGERVRGGWEEEKRKTVEAANALRLEWPEMIVEIMTGRELASQAPVMTDTAAAWTRLRAARKTRRRKPSAGTLRASSSSILRSAVCRAPTVERRHTMHIQRDVQGSGGLPNASDGVPISAVVALMQTSATRLARALHGPHSGLRLATDPSVILRIP